MSSLGLLFSSSPFALAVSINSPSGEGGEVNIVPRPMAVFDRRFPLILLQAKAVRMRGDACLPFKSLSFH